MQSQRIRAVDLAKLSAVEREEYLGDLTLLEAEALNYDWDFWARPEQRIPAPRPAGDARGDWINWALIAGRGFGKTRTAAECARQWIKDGFNRVNIIGATADDVRDIMVEGESGILAVCPKDERPRYVANKRRLEWPNGAISLLFTADAPERLRGKQHEKLICDELASWRYPEAWDQAMFGLRLGRRPQAVISTTPQPTKIIKDLVADPRTHVTGGSTYDNFTNLADAFIAKIVTKYEGTRLGRQELYAEILGDTPGALWDRGLIDETRCKSHDAPSEYSIVVVAIDPPTTSGENADECGIVVAARAHNGHCFILEDCSSQGEKPIEWAARAIKAFRRHKANYIVGEVNNGGELVAAVLRQVDENLPFRPVHASRGKVARAEPVATFYERKLAHHIGCFPKLEDQMCAMTSDFDPKAAGYSPDRVDALVWALTDILDSPGAGRGFYELTKKEAAAAAAADAAQKAEKPKSEPAVGSVEWLKAQN